MCVFFLKLEINLFSIQVLHHPVRFQLAMERKRMAPACMKLSSKRTDHHAQERLLVERGRADMLA